MNKKILLISEHSLLGGGAGFQRIKCYAKALQGLDFFCLDAQSKNLHLLKFRTSEEVPNLHFSEVERPKRNYLYRNFFRFFDFVGPLRLCRYIRKNYSNQEVTILLYSHYYPLFALMIRYMGKMLKYRVVVEKNEMDIGIILNSTTPAGLASLFFYLLFPYRCFTSYRIDRLTKRAAAVIAISSKIRRRYEKHTQVVQVPILVDMKRFPLVEEASDNEKIRVIFLGSITSKKDGLLELLDALSRLGPERQNLQIDLYGTGNKHLIKDMKAFIGKNNLEQTIDMKGYIQGTKVPGLLPTYDFSLLLRASNIQTENGFSTKLGEYLACGVPVLYTNVSDNASYLTDRFHGFQVDFPIEKNLPDTLQDLLQISKAEKEKMGQAARKLAQQHFDYQNHADSLREALAS